MFERMLDKSSVPAVHEMTAYCGDVSLLFTQLNDWLKQTFSTESKTVFPYGNSYGWGIAHKKKDKLVCNVFPENGAFTVMIRLSNEQFKSAYDKVSQYTRDYIDNKYDCGEGGWIQYRVSCPGQEEDIKRLLTLKCS